MGEGREPRREGSLGETSAPHPDPLPAGGERENARSALRAAAAQFGFSATPRLDAELLLAHALGIARERLLLTLDDHQVPPAFAELVVRRARHEPVAYLTGTRAFWTIELAVDARVLIPRADSETLLEAAVEHFAGTPGPARVVDLGTGSGALLLAALDQWPAATGVGIDASPAALEIAGINVARLAPGRAEIVAGDWAGTGAAFDLVLCNPPYIAADAKLPAEVADYEPASALFSGPDGHDDLLQIAAMLRSLLAPGGVACIEIGHDQGEWAQALFRGEGFTAKLRQDLGGRDRCVIVTA